MSRQPLLRAVSELRAQSEVSLPRLAPLARAAFDADIRERGVLVPLEITADGVVLDGGERLAAAARLGISQLPVRVVAPADEVDFIIRAALQRRHLSASQRAALALELDSHLEFKARAERRRLANLRPDVAALPPQGKTRDHVAEIAGVSGRTVQDAAVVQQHDPELFTQIKNGVLSAELAARRVRRQLRDASITPAPALPEGPFGLIYADPPWQLGNPDSEHAPERHYPTMPLPEIAALQPPAGDDACLFLWAVNSLLPEALQVIDAWGFSYKSNLVWVKPSVGLGVWTRNRHELLLFATRGQITPPEPGVRPDSVVEARRGRHSEKPAAAYQRIEAAYPHLSKLELFARGHPRPGWAVWGNQTEPAAA